MESEQTLEMIACRVGKTTIGIDLSRVQEVNRLVNATFVPGVGAEVSGLINLRGSLVTVLDLGQILHGTPLEPQSQSRNVIVQSLGERFGLLVDSVGGVIQSDGLLEDLPSHISSRDAQWFRGLTQLENEVMLVLDLDAVLGNQEEPAEA
ncbi:MAG TPA: hypothetical protein ENI87_10870 [bacterium]|nr:hypothetical protein [bacterium]